MSWGAYDSSYKRGFPGKHPTQMRSLRISGGDLSSGSMGVKGVVCVKGQGEELGSILQMGLMEHFTRSPASTPMCALLEKKCPLTNTRK